MSLEDIYRFYRRPVWAVLVDGRVHRDAVEDLVEDVFAELLEIVQEEGMPADVSKVLFHMAAAEARNHRRRRQRQCQRTDAEAAPESVALPSSRSNPERLLGRAAWAKAVTDALDELPAAARALLRRLHFDGLSEKDAAIELKCSHENVRVRNHRAIGSLRKLFTRNFNKDPR